MNRFPSRKQITLTTALFISLGALIAFMVQTKIMSSPLVLVVISLFIIFPYRKKSRFIRRLLLLTSFLLIGWLLSDLGFTILPFVISLLMAYLLAPVVNYFEIKKIPRWLSALVIDIVFFGVVTTIALFVFPLIFSQLKDAIATISSLFTSVSIYLDSDKFIDVLSGLGIKEESLKPLIKTELIPRLEGILSTILEALLSLLTRLSSIASQLINAVLIPILFFYFLKDFKKLKILLRSILEKKNKKLLNDLKRINNILRKYIGWQIIAAMIVATVCSTFFSIFGIPYPIVLGVLCGFLNPIPYLGIFASMIICFLTVIIVNSASVWTQILIIAIIINTMHFINAYFLEPNIAGKQVGLHPALLIASLFVFGGLFGIIGLLIAVPLTATLVMFFNDWYYSSIIPFSSNDDNSI